MSNLISSLFFVIASLFVLAAQADQTVCTTTEFTFTGKFETHACQNIPAFLNSTGGDTIFSASCPQSYSDISNGRPGTVTVNVFRTPGQTRPSGTGPSNMYNSCYRVANQINSMKEVNGCGTLAASCSYYTNPPSVSFNVNVIPKND